MLERAVQMLDQLVLQQAAEEAPAGERFVVKYLINLAVN